MNLQHIAKSLGGNVRGNYVVAPGPVMVRPTAH